MDFLLRKEILCRLCLLSRRDLFRASRSLRAITSSWEFLTRSHRLEIFGSRLQSLFRALVWVIRRLYMLFLLTVVSLPMLSVISVPKPPAAQRIVSLSISSPGLCPLLAFVQLCSGKLHLAQRFLSSGSMEEVSFKELGRIRYLMVPTWRRITLSSLLLITAVSRISPTRLRVVGILGFLDGGNAFPTLNMGLQDTILALTWVRQNIMFFGGDPDRVTGTV